MDTCPDHDALAAKNGGGTPHFDTAVKGGIPLGFETVGGQLKDTGKQPAIGFAKSITPSAGKGSSKHASGPGNRRK